ncbi:hypothetical protein OTU49_000859 [Cherax quadricarinatus]|uniref:Uncharacterized protein n=1 Tax=Cherax quadricarinatus TaxID=27406 RepID=A0AAW0XZK5_CHEQU
MPCMKLNTFSTKLVNDLFSSGTSLITSRYKEKATRMSVGVRDQVTPPRELAVFWTEYVIRHRGATQLRSPAAQLSWVEFLMLDLLFLFHITFFILFYFLRRIFRVVNVKIFRRDGKSKKKND